MSHIIAIQSTYQTVEVGLFDGTQCLAEQSIDKKEASGHLIPSLASLCSAQQWQLNRVSAIIVNQGPGPFTTLRTVIASVNGLSFASGVGLIGINALEALIIEFDPDMRYTVVALLNAFGGQVYYGIRYAQIADVIIGVGSIADVHNLLKIDSNTHIIGNGVIACMKELQEIFADSVHVNAAILHASLKTVAHMGLKKIHDGYMGVQHISPYYLKNHPAQSV